MLCKLTGFHWKKTPPSCKKQQTSGNEARTGMRCVTTQLYWLEMFFGMKSALGTRLLAMILYTLQHTTDLLHLPSEPDHRQLSSKCLSLGLPAEFALPVIFSGAHITPKTLLKGWKGKRMEYVHLWFSFTVSVFLPIPKTSLRYFLFLCPSSVMSHTACKFTCPFPWVPTTPFWWCSHCKLPISMNTDLCLD